MNRKIIWCLLTTALLSTVPFVEAQQPKKVPRIGFLRIGSPPDPFVEAFRQGLRDLGYLEGKTILIEYRYAEGKSDRLPNLAAELVRIKCDLIVTADTPPIRAAKNATREIPIVMAVVADPVAAGLVAGLARPGGNITGLSTLAPELDGK
ncbi:MAG: ABC transporter substrate-binding protein, partial [Deltaproteobacteria bacterium]|nr:ABC transporter substrate-binding protein [Deltaproteobacteria bacterium]